MPTRTPNANRSLAAGLHAERVRRRRRTLGLLLLAPLLLVVVVILLAGGGGGSADPAQAKGLVALVESSHSVGSSRASDITAMSPAALQAWLSKVPPAGVHRSGLAQISYQVDQARLARAVHAAALKGGGTVTVPTVAVASSINLPVERQRLHNDCEATALSLLLRSLGRQVDQLQLQRELPTSGPLDPQPTASGINRWGDPDLGFVGRPNSGGTAGGYGVYQAPIIALARRHGVALRDLTGHSATDLYTQVLAGHAVMAWVGLSNGPYQTWLSPAGKRIVANFGEHTVVLTGLNGDSISLDDPLSGQSLVWSRATFGQSWQALGRRAVTA